MKDLEREVARLRQHCSDVGHERDALAVENRRLRERLRLKPSLPLSASSPDGGGAEHNVPQSIAGTLDYVAIGMNFVLTYASSHDRLAILTFLPYSGPSTIIEWEPR